MSYQALLAQRNTLDEQIKQEFNRLRAEALASVRDLVNQHELAANDIFGKPAASASKSKSGTTVAPKYRDPATGATWTGRGKEPAWIRGQDRSTFAITA